MSKRKSKSRRLFLWDSSETKSDKLTISKKNKWSPQTSFKLTEPSNISFFTKKRNPSSSSPQISTSFSSKFQRIQKFIQIRKSKFLCPAPQISSLETGLSPTPSSSATETPFWNSGTSKPIRTTTWIFSVFSSKMREWPLPTSNTRKKPRKYSFC